MTQWQRVAIIIVAVLTSCALMGSSAWWAFQALEKPSRLRNFLLLLGAVYIAGAINGIWGVVNGSAPLWSMLFLPIPVLVAWLYFRSAARISVPPKS
jgi:hypothetical protein